MTLSPELGSIDVTPAASAPAAGRNYLAGAGAALVGVVSDIQDGKKISDAEDEFNEITDDVLEQAKNSSGEDPDFVGPPTSRGSKEVEILGNIRTLQAGIAQATGSRKADLELKLRTKIQDLGNADPRLRARYAAELSRFTRTDPELFAIEMLDTSNRAFSAQSAKDLQAIKDHAVDDLGMDPAMTFGDQAWVREYMYRDGLDDSSEKNALVLGAIQSGEELDARATAETFTDSMQGNANRVRASVKRATQLTQEIGMALRDPTLPGAKEAITQWNNWGKQAVVQDLSMAIFQIEEDFGNIPINQAHTAAYQGAKALRDDQVAALNTLLEGVAADSPTITMAYEAYQTMQAIDFERQNPKFVNDARNMRLIEPMLALIDADFGAEGDILRHELAGFLKQGAEQVMGRTFGRTRLGDLPPNATPAQLDAHYRGIRATGNIYDNGQTGAEAQRAFASTDLSLASRDVYLQMAKDDAMSPIVAQAQVGSAAANIDQLVTTGPVENDALAQAVSDISNPLWLDMARIAQNSSQPAVVEQLGEQIQNLVFKYEPYRLSEYKRLRTTQVTNDMVLAHVVSVDDTNIDKGEVVFRVDEDLIRRRLAADPANATRYAAEGFGNLLEAETQFAVKIATEAAAELTRQVTKDLRTYAHGAVLTQGLTTPSYTATWDSNRFDRFFGILPSQEPVPDTDPLVTARLPEQR